MWEAAPLAVQEVELVGGESWLEHNSVAIAAITAAALAALVAVINQRAQLRHDRELRNHDHIRDTLDDAIIVANNARTAVEHFFNLVTTAEDQRQEKQRQLSKEAIDHLAEQREQAFSQIQSMRRAKARLEIRLEDSDRVVKAYQETLDAFAGLFRQTFRGIRKNRDAASREEDADREQTLDMAFSSFQTACREWLTGTTSKRSI
jgi:hypothetical protein